MNFSWKITGQWTRTRSLALFYTKVEWKKIKKGIIIFLLLYKSIFPEKRKQVKPWSCFPKSKQGDNTNSHSVKLSLMQRELCDPTDFCQIPLVQCNKKAKWMHHSESLTQQEGSQSEDTDWQTMTNLATAPSWRLCPSDRGQQQSQQR